MARPFRGLVPIQVVCSLAGVAQLVEQRFRKPQVVSSILTAGFPDHPIKAKTDLDSCHLSNILTLTSA